MRGTRVGPHDPHDQRASRTRSSPNSSPRTGSTAGQVSGLERLRARPKASRLSNLRDERRATSLSYEMPHAKVRNLSRPISTIEERSTRPRTVRGYLRQPSRSPKSCVAKQPGGISRRFSSLSPEARERSYGGHRWVIGGAQLARDAPRSRSSRAFDPSSAPSWPRAPRRSAEQAPSPPDPARRGSAPREGPACSP